MSNSGKNLCERVSDILKQEGLDPTIFKRCSGDWALDLDIDIDFENETETGGITYNTDPNNDGVSFFYDIIGGISKEASDRAKSSGLIHPMELMAFQHSIALVPEDEEDKDNPPYIVLLSIDETGKLIKDADFATETGTIDESDPKYFKAGADFESAFRVMVRLYKAHYSPTPANGQRPA